MNQHLKWQNLLNKAKGSQAIFFNNGYLEKDEAIFKQDWANFTNECVNDVNNKLTHFSDKNRWDFAFFMLCELDKTWSFGILQNIVAQIPLIHQNVLGQERINVIMEHIQIAKYEYGFTLNDMGKLAELLAINKTLKIEQFNLALNLILQIGNHNLNADEFQEFIFAKFECAIKANF